ncbi:dihydroxy-acid dehydratase [Achromobacter ruhlandii]|uniref:IlvD/Edd family dehydratase n=1 Tax=Achromobacter ruhlandii TaxID=72557 RepID=UPI000743139D|nr:IlvD/Edd family dehydratase [Achromobacter ruhlandii]ALX83681.1 dihydroxy-acid dehydratase [Achromobacter denitrificans]MCV6796259.1 dihydroxy-acid dehydratase [Achromobacter ruhlandii]MCV6802667.1 dihydroxy-acid dehydratase [Achromobacter ruhlandii]MCV6811005.1 dihydroxy-acid dehydratase [Achromobacter ruhlandii]MCV6820117.1 dihydroxy-acid dehydratase [Achromobacter ruhlandii]
MTDETKGDKPAKGPFDSDGARSTGVARGLTNYGDTGFSLFLRKAFIKGAGLSDDALARPIIGIVNTGSSYNPCHGNAPQLIEAVKRGVMLAGGLPMDFPTISVHESFSQPTSMYLRNLMSMDTEEMIRAQPMDAVVLIGGCDKTVPAQLMGASSAGVPAIQLVTGSMLTGSHRGERVGACTDCRRYWGRYRAEEIDAPEIADVNNQLVASVGTCSVMGTASTMACLTEAMGMMVSGGASAPAVTADRVRVAERTGATAVAMAAARLTPDRIITGKSIENALRVLLAIGGSTNGIVHLTAIAGRLGINIDLAGLDRMSRETPVLVDLKPSGQHYMEDFHHAGGMLALLRELRPLLHLDALTVSGRTLGEELDDAPAPFKQDVIRSVAAPIYPVGGLAVLRGNLAPGGAIIKQSAANPKLMEHEGRAVVFEDAEDMARRIDDEALDVTADDVLVLKRIGPTGAPGMPEAGYMPIPKKLARAGVKDMVRISDGRMSGTAAGTIVLHVTPEAAIGGPLAYVQNGDRIRLSVARREIALLVEDAELARRMAAGPVERPAAERGYRKLFLQTVTQADQGVDFDFLRAGATRDTVPRQ